MERIKKRHYALIFILAVLFGILMRAAEQDSFKIVKNSTVFAPENEYALVEASENKKVNINTANIYELDSIKGIGESYAKRIVDYREEHGDYEVIEDIMKVKGIGEKTFERIKNYICVE